MFFYFGHLTCRFQNIGFDASLFFPQTVSQDPRVLNNDVFNGFLVFAQNETQRAGGGQDEVPIDIYLTSGQKVTLTIPATLQTDDLLEVGLRPVGLNEW